MAITTIRSATELETGFVLAPERYDPRRTVTSGQTSTSLSSIATIARNIVQPGEKLGSCLVLDTSDAREGIIISRTMPVNGAEIGSAKKVIKPNDVIISRLRPYLRQVAFVDDAIQHSKDAQLVCSTEFFVLRSNDDRSIAFLVPFLLSGRVQEVLAASQEGGHHPRINESTLTTLPVPEKLIEERDAMSANIEKSVRLYRESETIVSNGVATADAIRVS